VKGATGVDDVITMMTDIPYASASCPPPVCASVTDEAVDHCGRGILSGDFIKPDPTFTRSETRAFLLDELRDWLTGRICDHAKEVNMILPDAEVLERHLADGTWPAARLFAVLRAIENSDTGFRLMLPDDYDERFRTAGAWAAAVCAEYLEGRAPETAAAELATGFVRTDRLPAGRTIESFWNYSPFEPLRSAPPLTDDPEPEEETETEEAEEEAEEAEEAAVTDNKPSSDYPLDVLTGRVGAFLVSNISLPAWTFVAVAAALVTYVYGAVAMCSRA